MPPFEYMDRRDLVTLWPITGLDRHAQAVVSPTPQFIYVRWVQKENRVLDRTGNTISVDATAVVAQDIDIGSIMRVGQWTGTDLPTNGLYQVKGFPKTSDLKDRFERRTVGLMRFNQKLPVGS